MKSSFFEGPFVCPECGSRQPEPTPAQDDQQPEDVIGRRYTCANCQSQIPVHLAQRWGGISIEDAKKEWREVYRDAATTFETRAKL